MIPQWMTELLAGSMIETNAETIIGDGRPVSQDGSQVPEHSSTNIDQQMTDGELLREIDHDRHR